MQKVLQVFPPFVVSALECLSVQHFPSPLTCTLSDALFLLPSVPQAGVWEVATA